MDTGSQTLTEKETKMAVIESRVIKPGMKGKEHFKWRVQDAEAAYDRELREERKLEEQEKIEEEEKDYRRRKREELEEFEKLKREAELRRLKLEEETREIELRKVQEEAEASRKRLEAEEYRRLKEEYSRQACEFKLEPNKNNKRKLEELDKFEKFKREAEMTRLKVEEEKREIELRKVQEEAKASRKRLEAEERRRTEEEEYLRQERELRLQQMRGPAVGTVAGGNGDNHTPLHPYIAVPLESWCPEDGLNSLTEHLEKVELTLRQYGIPEGSFISQIANTMKGAAAPMWAHISATYAPDYQRIKDEFLKYYSVSESNYRQQFRSMMIMEGETWLKFMDRCRIALTKWHQAGKYSNDEEGWTEMLIKAKVYDSLSVDTKKFVIQSGVERLMDVIMFADRHMAAGKETPEMCHQQKGENHQSHQKPPNHALHDQSIKDNHKPKFATHGQQHRPLTGASGAETECIQMLDVNPVRRSNSIYTLTNSAAKENDDVPHVVVGYGCDLHRFKNSERGYVALGGIKIEYHKDIDAHSDGDVILHALVDALLGATGNGDIGEYFPPSEARWKDKDSRYFVEHVLGMIILSGYSIGNIDVTVIAEDFKIMPHKVLIKNNIASMLDVNPTRVNIKAKTNEKLGFLGRNEAIEAHVVATLFMKQN